MNARRGLELGCCCSDGCSWMTLRVHKDLVQLLPLVLEMFLSSLLMHLASRANWLHTLVHVDTAWHFSGVVAPWR